MWFSSHLLAWYRTHKRALPWRQTKDPYTIWISEIILQQTRVDQGLPYYDRFIAKYPNVKTLADAQEEEVLNIWQGLGYYSRARNLHFTAKAITNAGGLFPTRYAEIIKLKGVGAYTAAAISSICFDEPKAVVDGNVFRLLSRFYGIGDPIDTTEGKKIFDLLAQKVMDRSDPGDYNQAIMEFGALICKPSNPDCDSCILRTKCVARKTNMVTTYPVKTKKLKQKDRYFNYILIWGDRGGFYRKRTNKDIWQNMYEPLLIESKKHLEKNEIFQNKVWSNIFGPTTGKQLIKSESMEHKLSHQIIKATFWETRIESSLIPKNSGLREIEDAGLDKIPLPRLIEKYLELRK